MRAAINPYSPGSGRKPPALVGRETEIRTMENLVERTAHELTGRRLLLVGLRGVGKTVLLNEVRSRADEAGWITVGIEAPPGCHDTARDSLARRGQSHRPRQCRCRRRDGVPAPRRRILQGALGPGDAC